MSKDWSWSLLIVYLLIASYFVVFAHGICPSDQFECANGLCVPLRWHCDDENDCGDNSDEVGCAKTTCSASEFMCANGNCIPQIWRCDGITDCVDRSDEIKCTTTTVNPMCRENEFRCHSSGCINFSFVCDGEANCPDKSDEMNCPITCNPYQFQCQNKHCIPGDFRCDGVDHCGDGSDEQNCPSTITCKPDQFQCQNKSCIPGDFQCDGVDHCGDGSDEQNCPNQNECQLNNGGCSQICVDTTIGFHCECNHGFKLVDNSSCEEKAAIFLAGRRDIHRIDLETLEDTTIVNGLRASVALGYDISSQKIFWSDVADATISSAPIKTGTPITVVIRDELNTPDGIAIDWIYGNIYWTDTGKNRIEMADMNGKLRKILFSQDLDEPRAIVLNPLEGWMFWSDWGDPAKIERAGMDGSHRNTIVSSDIAWPNGLALDLPSRRIYWIDAKLHIICSADYDGSNRRVILSSRTLVKHPFSIDVFEDWLYWSDWGSSAIHRVKKFNGTEFSNIAVGFNSPNQVLVYHRYKQPKGENYCAPPHGGQCSHLCLPAPKLNEFSANFSCACPDSMALAADQKTCIAIGPCSFHQFQCANGQCLPLTSVCDGEDDCGDGSDEVGCGTTAASRTIPTESIDI